MPPAEPCLSLRRWASNSHHWQPFDHYPPSSKKRQHASWKALRAGIYPTGNRTHTHLSYILDGGTLHPSDWNINILSCSRFVKAKSRSTALHISNWTINWESKIQSSGHCARSNLVFYIKLLLSLLLKKSSESKPSSDVCMDFTFAAKACSWIMLHQSCDSYRH